MKKYCVVVREYRDIWKNVCDTHISEITNPVKTCTIEDLLLNLCKEHTYRFDVEVYENELTASAIHRIDNSEYNLNNWDKIYIIPSRSRKYAVDCVKIFEHFLKCVYDSFPFN